MLFYIITKITHTLIAALLFKHKQFVAVKNGSEFFYPVKPAKKNVGL